MWHGYQHTDRLSRIVVYAESHDSDMERLCRYDSVIL